MVEWLIGDTHFFHTNMCKYCGRPRDFDQRIINAWRDQINPEDIVYHIGDVAFGNRDTVRYIVKSLPGIKILILGNHDKFGAEWYLENGFSFVSDSLIVDVYIMGVRTKILLSHVPMAGVSLVADFNIHGHFHNNQIKKCERNLVNRLTCKHYLFSLEKVGYTPILLNGAISDDTKRVYRTIDLM